MCWLLGGFGPAGADEQWTLDMVSEAQAREGGRGHGFVEAK